MKSPLPPEESLLRIYYRSNNITCKIEEIILFDFLRQKNMNKGVNNMRHLMSPLDFTTEELDQLFDLANDIEKHPDKYAHACEGKKLAT